MRNDEYIIYDIVFGDEDKEITDINVAFFDCVMCD